MDMISFESGEWSTTLVRKIGMKSKHVEMVAS
jgi:hypothetical protein